MTITQLKYVLALVEYGSFTAAAAHCNVKQPSLSMQIQKLEDELDTKIFNRSKKPIQLTPIGEKIVTQAKLIINESSRIVDIIEQQKGYVGGDFKLGVLPSILSTLVPIFIHHFTVNNPKVNLFVEELSLEDIIQKLNAGHIDAALVSTPLNNEMIKERVLYYEPLVGVISNHHILKDKECLKPSDIHENELIVSNDSFCNIINNFVENNANNEPVKFKINNLDSLISLAVQGVGVTIVPYLHSLKFKEEYQENFKMFEEPVPAREVSLVYHKTQLKMQIIEVLKSSIDMLIRGKIPFQDVKIIPPKK